MRKFEIKLNIVSGGVLEAVFFIDGKRNGYMPIHWNNEFVDNIMRSALTFSEDEIIKAKIFIKNVRSIRDLINKAYEKHRSSCTLWESYAPVNSFEDWSKV